MTSSSSSNQDGCDGEESLPERDVVAAQAREELLLPGAVDELEQERHHYEQEVEDAVDLPEVGTQQPHPSQVPHFPQLPSVRVY